jgi:uncharacterized RmlC-like cupin family protein
MNAGSSLSDWIHIPQFVPRQEADSLSVEPAIVVQR